MVRRLIGCQIDFFVRVFAVQDRSLTNLAVRRVCVSACAYGCGVQYLLPIAKQLNQIPLPPLRESYSHILLPPQHQQLGTVNFNLVPRGRSGAAQELEEEQEDDDEDGDSESEVNGDGQDGDHDEAAPSSEGGKRREDPGRQDGEAAADQDRNGTRADNDDDDNGKEDESMGTGADAEEAAADNSGRGNDDKKEDESTSTADRNGAVAPVSARSPPRPTIRQDEPEAAVAGHMS